MTTSITCRPLSPSELAQKLPVPCAVKVINGGSSIGVALPDTREELEKAGADLICESVEQLKEVLK